MSYRTYVKDPDATRDYVWDFAPFLAAGDTIASHVMVVDPGITLGTNSHTPSTVTARISGGTAGLNYNVTARVTTTAGQIDDRTIVLQIREQ